MLHKGVVDRQMSRDDMKCELTQLNVVFDGGANKKVYDMPEILRITNVGSIYTLIVRDYNEDFASKLKSNGASLVEPLDISLEELFVVLGENNLRKNEESK